MLLIGFFLKRKNTSLSSIKNLLQCLYIVLFELKIIISAITDWNNKKLVNFDPLVGDRKCQVRAIMILKLARIGFKVESDQINKIELLIINVQKLISKLKNFNYQETKHFIKKIKGMSFLDILEKNSMNFQMSTNLEFISLCFFMNLDNKDQCVEFEDISRKQFVKLFDIARKLLCDLSINFEKEIALRYASEEVQNSLKQIESKGPCRMTGFFPSIIPILKKMKESKYIFINKVVCFCICGGINNKIIKLYQGFKSNFKEVSINNFKLDQELIVLESYKYSGSFMQLKKILKVSNDATLIPKEYQKLCICLNSNNIEKQDSNFDIEQAILAVFAQHPQFTKDVDIDFDGLNLSKSKLKKEYGYLKTLPGYSVENMNNLWIMHIYPSTLFHALKFDSHVANSVVN